MSYVPAVAPETSEHTISTVSANAIGLDMIHYRTAQVAASTVWPSANLAIYVPFTIARAVTVLQLGWYNGATAAGNVDAGIYTAGGTKVITTGATAQAGTTALQKVDIADTFLAAAQYYFALSCSLGTATIFRWTPLAPIPAALGIFTQVTAHPLPATATFALDSATTFVPFVMAQIRATL